jgi:indole-3-glycerol phosphate synthase
MSSSIDTAHAADLLRTIIAATERIVELRRDAEPLPVLEKRAMDRTPGGDRFEAALGAIGRVNVIAECKRRSPSRGVLAPTYDPVTIARAYEAGGAAAISVLTEPTFFDGALEHLVAVRDAVALPLLRKDFVVDEYQVFEARANGADAILLIVAGLGQAQMQRLQLRAWELGLAALVEVHNEEELARAIDIGARIIGVNNRNLRTLAVDKEASYRLAAQMPDGVVPVSESGLQTREDLERLSAAGYRAFLIGERFMTDPDPASAIRALVGRTFRSAGDDVGRTVKSAGDDVGRTFRSAGD